MLRVKMILLLSAVLALGSVSAGKGNVSEKGDNMKFGMQAVMTATPGKGYELAELMLQASRVVSNIEGCKLYIVQQSVEDANKVLITEVWESKEAHQASLTNDKVREVIEKAKPIIGGMEHNPATFIGGHGL